MFDYFYGQSGEMFSYFRVPKILFRDIKFKNLSTDAKTLYGILLDRMGLSVKNGWLDEQGGVYIIALMLKLTLNLSAFVLALPMLYIFGCGLYTLYCREWTQFLILFVAEFGCFLLIVAGTAIVEAVERFSEWLTEL